MRIALIHSRYRHRGGEDVTVDFEEQALGQAGHQVFRYEIASPSSKNPLETLTTALHASHNPRLRRRLRQFLVSHRIEVSHVHNWFPKLSPSVHQAAREAKTRVVQTLHNFRLGCATGTFTRNQSPCFLCLNDSRDWAIHHRCYQDSKVASWIWRNTMDRAFRNQHIQRHVDVFIAPSREVAFRHVQMGIPPSLIEVVPHGVPDPFAELGEGIPRFPRRPRAVFVGRFEKAKGIELLAQTWRHLDIELVCVGEGTDQEIMESLAKNHPKVRLLGALSREATRDVIARSSVLISPHRVPETFGLTIVEAMSAGRPVIASRLGGPKETVGEGGVLLDSQDPLQWQQEIRSLVFDPDRLERLGQSGRRRFLAHYTQEQHITALQRVFAPAPVRVRHAI